MNVPRLQAHFLRLVAAIQMLTIAVVFMPVSWLALWHAWLGLGAMPDGPFVRYVVRGAAFVQGALGILLWAIASDVVRFRPLVVLTGVIYAISAPAFLVIDSKAGMPWFWCVFDGAFCFIIGGILLALCFVPSASRRDQATD